LHQASTYDSVHNVIADFSHWLLYVLAELADVKYSEVACLTAVGTHMPCEITQCYLPLGRGDIPPLPQPILAGTQFSDRALGPMFNDASLINCSIRAKVTVEHYNNRFTALWNLSGKTRVSRYQKNIHPLLSS